MKKVGLLTLVGFSLTLLGFAPAFSQENRAMIAREYFTPFGILTFTIEGNQVTGTYPHEAGKIVGTLAGQEIKGNWQQRDGAGAIILTFSPDFNSFKARYNRAETPDKWATDWAGMRKPILVVREYKTAWGLLTCNFEGSQLSCTYPWYNGKIMGELKGNSFKGIWVQSNSGIGNLNITFAEKFGSFMGKYNDWNHHTEKWFDWTGVLKP